ncbi:hypothetical protein Q31b_43420 [Novipirellula aureliae]|uniref:Leucine Rich repeats (2 copies) n=1 Tax=Novipirellula aureliae TaxID=2527966 RepID=A0A5C6DN17_9BACT|nr:hypothetical protein [Novipirellula aureliae]TWU37554.1 hypothetical protein Q31b_43420 [Novipirellula aureliae]
MNRSNFIRRLISLFFVAVFIGGCGSSTNELVRYADKNKSLELDLANGRITGITIRKNKSLHYSLDRISALGKCQTIDLVGLSLDADDFEPFSKLPIYSLHMTDCRMTKDARLLISKMEKLTRLDILVPFVGDQIFIDAIKEDPDRIEMEFSDSDLEQLSRLHRLEQLNLGNHRGLTGIGFRAWDANCALRKINLYGSGITDDGIKEISRFSELQTLTLKYSLVTSDGLLVLARIKSLYGPSVWVEDMEDFAIRYNAAYKKHHPEQLIVPFISHLK